MCKTVETVLIVDDDKDNNMITSYLINKHKIANKIIVALDGLEAIQFLKSNPPPDLILLDLNMPRMNGWEFLEEYKKIDAKTKDSIIIIMITTSLNPDDRELAGKYKVGFINKPLTGESLKGAIEERETIKN